MPLLFSSCCRKTRSQTMMQSRSERAMSQTLLRLLILSSLCSFVVSDSASNEEESSDEPWSGSGETPLYVPPQLRMGDQEMPPADHMWHPELNISDWDVNPVPVSIDPGMPPHYDETYCDRFVNAPVPPPSNQVPYFCVCSFCKGTVGMKGMHGDRGLPGEPGSPGRRGRTGFRGYRGFTGPQGMKGLKGDNGEKGQAGIAGYTGRKGSRGFKGEKGDQGTMGLPGGQGPQGPTGTCPASCERAQGRPGPQGPPGPAGGRGLPGVQGRVGPKGMMGPKGDLGRPGDPGVKGLKGDEGEQGVCECSDGMDGVNGQMGPKGDKGDKGDLGFKGDQGPMGLKGNQGDMGLMGGPGPCSPAIQSAFSAGLVQSFPNSGQPVAFNRVLTNNLGHFNPSMGMYTAPVNGTYVFSFHLAVAVRPLKVGIFINFEPFAITTEVNNPGTCSHEVVVHLSMGDRAWLQVKDTETNGMFTNSESSSTFSGYLLYPDSCAFPMGRGQGLPEPFPTGGFMWPPTTAPV